MLTLSRAPRSTRLVILVLTGTLLLACSADRGRGTGTPPPTPPGPDSSTPPVPMVDSGTPPTPPVSGDGCAEDARWIYVVDRSGTLLRFQPDSLTFTAVGPLNCPVAAGVTPFSMSVDRDAMAWVVYQNGQLFNASTSDASCTATSFVPNQAGFENFGMGFVSDSAGSSSETLFVAGGPSLDMLLGTSSRLASIDTSSLTLTPRSGTLGGWPELTGTGAGDLYGFFPVTDPFAGGVTTVKRIDRDSGTPIETFNLTELNTTGVTAWAFAFWGGRFYIFVEVSLGGTAVHRFEPMSGTFETVVPNSGYSIVGAGVSTCAPVELI